MLITAFPRSGSHFLRESIMLNYNIEGHIDKTHTPDRGRNAVTIIRNPKECISSLMSMDILFHRPLYLPEQDSDAFFIQRINQLCSAYVDSMEYYHKYIKEIYPINFNTLVLKPNIEIKKLLDHYNIKYKSKKKSIEVKDDYDLKFVASSKNIKEYDKIYNLSIPLATNAELAYNYMIKAIDNKEHIS